MKNGRLHINIKYWKVILLFGLPIVSTLMHLRAFPIDLIGPHVWRQSQTMTNVVNFYEGDFNIMNPKRNNQGNRSGIYRMEFPIMQWSFAAFAKLTGNPLLTSRILTFVISLMSVLGFYFLLKSLFNNTTIALIGAWALNFSPAFYYYAVSPIPDNLALCLGIWSLAVFFQSLPEPNWKSTVLAALLMSLSMAAKMPFILFYAVPFGFYFQKIIQRKLILQDVLKGIVWLICFTPTLLWYLMVIPTWEGNGIVAGMLNLADSPMVLLDYLQFNLFSNLPELLLNFGAVPMFLAGFYFIKKYKKYKHPHFNILLFWSGMTLLYFLFELNMIGKVHDYYLFPFYPILFIIVAFGAYQLSRLQRGKVIVLFLLFSLPIFAFVRIQGRWDTNNPRFNKDLLINKTELQALSDKSDLIVAGNDRSDAIWFYHLDRKGWGFSEAYPLQAKRLKVMISKGAKYLYTDSKSIIESPAFQPYLQHKVGQYGGIHVYKLD